jgi:hypothetical protein
MNQFKGGYAKPPLFFESIKNNEKSLIFLYEKSLFFKGTPCRMLPDKTFLPERYYDTFFQRKFEIVTK